MKKITMFAMVVGSATLAMAFSANAKTPANLSDLLGAKGAGAESALESRGFSNVTMTHGVQYWWNAESKTCVGIKVAQGKYKSIDTVSPAQCQQKDAAKAAKKADKAQKNLTGNAESACMSAINSNYGGNVKDLKVVSSEFSQANSEVVIEAIGVRGEQKNERWHCLSSNSGQVADLRVME